MNQIRLRLDLNNIVALSQGKVLFKNDDGTACGTGESFTHGDHPVEIGLTQKDQEALRTALLKKGE